MKLAAYFVPEVEFSSGFQEITIFDSLHLLIPLQAVYYNSSSRILIFSSLNIMFLCLERERERLDR